MVPHLCFVMSIWCMVQSTMGLTWGVTKPLPKKMIPATLRRIFITISKTSFVQHSGRWDWSISRPALVYDFTPGRPRNPVSLVAVYAEISRALGLSLNYPGSEISYKALVEGVSANHLAKAIVWIATTEDCINEAFNVTNGDHFRWENIWPRIATYFQMSLGSPQRLSLSQTMSDKGSLWDQIVHEHKLIKTDLEDIALWSFGDFMFGSDWDLCSSTTKLRCAGFADIVDTEAMIFDLFDLYRSQKIIA